MLYFGEKGGVWIYRVSFLGEGGVKEHSGGLIPAFVFL